MNQAANQLLLSPNSAMVVSFVTPFFERNSSSCVLSRRSRTGCCCRSLFQFTPIAPAAWPWSYDDVSTSTSKTRTLGSLACATSQSVSTSVSGCAYWVVMASPPRRSTGLAAPRRADKEDCAERTPRSWHRSGDVLDFEQLAFIEKWRQKASH